jgi:hypothetical protein
MRKKISLIGLVSCGYTEHEIHRNRKDHLSAEALRTPKIGSLVDGNLADFIAVDRDPLALPDNQLQHINVVGTLARGKPVYQHWVIHFTIEDISNTPLFFRYMFLKTEGGNPVTYSDCIYGVAMRLYV